MLIIFGFILKEKYYTMGYMQIAEEISQLIKSVYPVIYLETGEKARAIEQLKSIAKQNGLLFFVWSASSGLRPDHLDGSYYRSRDPEMMLMTLLEILKPRKNADIPEGLFVLQNFEKYMYDQGVTRVFLDLINRIRNTKSTVVIISHEYYLPKNIAVESAHVKPVF